MAEFPALPLWTDAYLGDTTHLSTIQHGAYLLLLFAQWRAKDCALPDDNFLLAKYARLTTAQWVRMRPVIAPFFAAEDGRLFNRRLRDELNVVRQLRNQRVFAGRASALKRLSRGSTFVASPLNGRGAPTPTPTPTPTKKKEGSARGARWAPNAVIPEDWRLAAAAIRHGHRLPEIDLGLEAEKFTNYWASKSGASATKLDWRKTWINWVLVSRAEGTRNGNGKQSANSNFLAGASSLIADLEREAGRRSGESQDADSPGVALLEA